MESLGIDISLLVAQLINFIVVLTCYALWVHKPFMGMLRSERKKKTDLDKALSDAQNKETAMQERENELKAQYEGKLKKEYNVMKKEIEEAKRGILEQAQEEATKMRERASESMKIERERMLSEVRSEAYEVANAMLERALTDIVDSTTQKSVTKQVIAKFPKMRA